MRRPWPTGGFQAKNKKEIVNLMLSVSMKQV
jgi:hypothetical protein